MTESRVWPSRLVDFHVRLGPQPDAGETLLCTLDAAGIDEAVVCAGGVVSLDELSRHLTYGGGVWTDADNAAVLSVCAESDGRLIPFFFGNPHRPAEAYADCARHYRGLEISPAVHGVGLTDPQTVALVEVAAAHGHPVYVVPVGSEGARASDLCTLAGTFPDTTFVLGHCGFVGIDTDALARVAPRDNIVVETSGAFMMTVRIALQRLGAQRVLFGSEFPLQHPDVELAKLRALNLTEPAWHDVTWRNAYRLLAKEDT